MNESKFEELVKKIQELKKAEKFDLSMDEDLSIAIMNLISLEEHFFYTAEKTGKDSYLDLLNETRAIRKELLGKMIPQHEGETWCISKHLLAGTMRIMEVGTKLLGAGKKEEAKQMFHNAYKVYSLFWALRLKLIDLAGVKKVPEGKLGNKDKGESGWSYQDIVNRLVNCCDE
ncbi:MAG: hypothetical protein AAB631_02955 [Patescibacteria group bacterium]